MNGETMIEWLTSGTFATNHLRDWSTSKKVQFAQSLYQVRVRLIIQLIHDYSKRGRKNVRKELANLSTLQEGG